MWGVTPKLPALAVHVPLFTLASDLSPPFALSHGPLDLADFFSIEFECAARKVPNTEAQPAFTLRDLGLPWNIEDLLDRAVVVPNVLSLLTVSVGHCLSCFAFTSSSSLDFRSFALSIIPNRMFFGALLCSAVRTAFSP